MFKKLALVVVLAASMALLALGTVGAAGPPLRADLGPNGWVQSRYWDRTTVHLKDALPNTEFVVTSLVGNQCTPAGMFAGTMLTGSMWTDARGKGVGKFGYTGDAPAGVSLINWGVGHQTGPNSWDITWDYWTECVSIPSG